LSAVKQDLHFGGIKPHLRRMAGEKLGCWHHLYLL
jgi:hypothetical protein